MISPLQKTILFSISNPAVHRNYGMFPGGVIDQLSARKDVRVVVVFRKGCEAPLAVSGKVETVSVEQTRTRSLIQRAFHFFYSYLIFTDTTKLVSSYGVRADKPRSRWRNWNYPIKIALSRTLGRSAWVRESFVPWMYDRVFSDRRYRELFDTYEPDLAFLPNIAGWPTDILFLHEATHHKRTATLGMACNWDHLSKYYLPFKPSHLLVWGEEVEHEAMRSQYYKKTDITRVGGPQVDHIIDPRYRETRADFLTRMKLPLSAKVILFASQGPYSLDGADYIDMILAGIEQGILPPDTHIIIRYHPAALLEDAKYEKFRAHPRIVIDERNGWADRDGALHYANVIAHADVVLTTYSTVTVDANLLDRPTIIVSFDGYQKRSFFQSVERHKYYIHFQMILGTGCIRVVRSEPDMIATLSEYLAHPEHDSEARKKVRELVFGFTDGKNAERIMREIVDRL